MCSSHCSQDYGRACPLPTRSSHPGSACNPAINIRRMPANAATPLDERHFRQSTRREKVVEHLLVGELLRHFWVQNADVQVLRPEVDAAGYDVVLTKGRMTRHVQIKASTGKRKDFPINISLAAQPSGCIVWLVVDEALQFKKFYWFGNRPGRRLPDLEVFPVARRTTPRRDGERPERRSIRSVPGTEFTELQSIEALAAKLFGSAR